MHIGESHLEWEELKLKSLECFICNQMARKNLRQCVTL